MTTLRRLTGLAAIMLVGACGQTTQGFVQPTTPSPDPTYPRGPYGNEVGETIPDLVFTGRHNTSLTGNLLDQPLGSIYLSSYRKDYKAIYVQATAEWCPGCNGQAILFQNYYTEYNQDGPEVAFLDVIAQSSMGTPADSSTLDGWATKYGITFDLAIDPTGTLEPYYNMGAFPSAIVIRTSDMQIFFKGERTSPAPITAAIDAITGLPPPGNGPPPIQPG